MRQSEADCGIGDNGGRYALPRSAWQRFNHCNVTADVLGSLAFQRRPIPLELVGVAERYAALFETLDQIESPLERAERFKDTMTVHFYLHRPEEAGYTRNRRQRVKMDYLRMLRGWLFNPDGREAAMLKGWVASRFGLLPRWHGGLRLEALEGEAYQRFLAMQSAGIYNTNALEQQLDLLYAYCQYELARRFPGQSHWTLYRGFNHIDQFDIFARIGKQQAIVLLNNLNSFSEERERADEFGDTIMTVPVPMGKIFFYNDLLPGTLKGEAEVMVIGGIYQAELATY